MNCCNINCCIYHLHLRLHIFLWRYNMKNEWGGFFMNAKKRNLSYDIIRIVALFMIVMVHVSAYMVIFFPDTDKPEWLVGNIFNGLARAGVPMFVLLSGALLLREDKPTDAKKFYKKNLLTMVFLAVGWIVAYGLFYAVLLPLAEGNPVHGKNFFDFLVSFKGSEYPHLWYMLMVIGLYLMIPVLRLFVKRENKKYIQGLIIVAVIVQFAARTADLFTVDAAVSVSSFLTKFHLEPMTGFIGYLLIGWYLNEYTLKKQTRIVLYAAGIAALVISTLVVYRSINEVGQIRDYMYSELSLPALLYGCALFVFIQSVCKNKCTQHRLTATMSDCTFGVYLFHVAVLEIFVRLVLPYEQFGTGKPLAYIAILYLVTLLVPFVIVKLTGYIKGVRKIFFVGSR